MLALGAVARRCFRASAARATTVVCVRHGGSVVMAADGQAGMGDVILKSTVRKIFRLRNNVLVGIAGSTSDALTLLDVFEAHLDEFPGELRRASAGLSKSWRRDRALSGLNALVIAADPSVSLIISGSGDVIEPDDGLLAIGSGGNFALAAARALVKVQEDLPARTIAETSLGIAADIDLHTNHFLTVEELDAE